MSKPLSPKERRKIKKELDLAADQIYDAVTEPVESVLIRVERDPNDTEDDVKRKVRDSGTTHVTTDSLFEDLGFSAEEAAVLELKLSLGKVE